MEKLRIGYARVDITPEDHVHLTGYGNDQIRLSEEFRDKIYSTCIAFTEFCEFITLYIFLAF